MILRRRGACTQRRNGSRWRPLSDCSELVPWGLVAGPRFRSTGADELDLAKMPPRSGTAVPSMPCSVGAMDRSPATDGSSGRCGRGDVCRHPSTRFLKR